MLPTLSVRVSLFSFVWFLLRIRDFLKLRNYSLDSTLNLSWRPFHRFKVQDWHSRKIKKTTLGLCSRCCSTILQLQESRTRDDDDDDYNYRHNLSYNSLSRLLLSFQDFFSHPLYSGFARIEGEAFTQKSNHRQKRILAEEDMRCQQNSISFSYDFMPYNHHCQRKSKNVKQSLLSRWKSLTPKHLWIYL